MVWVTTMYHDILHFWFEEIEPAQWFKKDTDFDQLIVKRFLEVHRQAIKGELYEWRSAPDGRLAEIIIIDQFSRNMFRNSPDAFANDTLALVLAQEAITFGADRKVEERKRGFFYLPFMHSESLKIHDVAMKIYSQEGMESSLEWEIKHRRIIERFGRYPHRNEALGRISTPEEIAFLQEPDSSF